MSGELVSAMAHLEDVRQYLRAASDELEALRRERDVLRKAWVAVEDACLRGESIFPTSRARGILEQADKAREG